MSPLLHEESNDMKFPVVLHKDADSEYGVIVPDVPAVTPPARPCPRRSKT